MKPVFSIVVAVVIGATVASTLRAEELSREKGQFFTGNGRRCLSDIANQVGLTWDRSPTCSASTSGTSLRNGMPPVRSCLWKQ
jgi:hypothetical protein